ncbi:MAG: hypothetical protein HDR13_00675 [Lachnospiraceae bacterium]|nr:hypothetical protein [Lachnospiraceae bacterium]
MAETLKEIVKNQEKLYRLEMIKNILYQTYNYVNDIYDRVQDEVCDLEDFEDYITESVIKTTKDNLDMLQKFL